MDSVFNALALNSISVPNWANLDYFRPLLPCSLVIQIVFRLWSRYCHRSGQFVAYVPPIRWKTGRLCRSRRSQHMNGILVVYLLVAIGGGGSLANVVTQSPSVLSNHSVTIPTQHVPDPHPSSSPDLRRSGHRHRHKSRPPPSPFSPSGLAVINRCTLAIQQKNRRKAQRWSDEYLIKPFTVELKWAILGRSRVNGSHFQAGCS